MEDGVAFPQKLKNRNSRTRVLAGPSQRSGREVPAPGRTRPWHLPRPLGPRVGDTSQSRKDKCRAIPLARGPGEAKPGGTERVALANLGFRSKNSQKRFLGSRLPVPSHLCRRACWDVPGIPLHPQVRSRRVVPSAGRYRDSQTRPGCASPFAEVSLNFSATASRCSESRP